MENPASTGGHLAVLESLGEALKPRTCLEFGTFDRQPLAIVHLDSAPLGRHHESADIEELLAPIVGTVIFKEESDAFFATRDLETLLEGKPLDLAVVEERPGFEEKLRDIMNIEARSHAGTVVMIISR